ncbi:monocarboxylate transporter 7-like [Anarrhichthys ocellatus]|uniref:monocarboxylate transporter 7-like n=1 Tax=Anarrhichthys ocellatus TaxID=433405 RepID=UPI0012EEE032|nr:monocarboxylate transporter 7-like [Anarrhichthys ocellatus]
MALCGVKGTRFLGPNVYPEAPDGGWGWAVAVAFFVVEAFTYGIIKIFGIFLQDLMEEFGETNIRVSWILSICVFVMNFNGPLSAVLTNRFGFQPVVMIGGLLIASGTIATSFTSSVNQMYITYGLIAGLGYCLTFLPTVTILSQYFTRRRSLVTAVASTGESLSMFALAPAFSALRDRIGWRHTMAVMGGLQSTIIIGGALLRPIIIKPRSTHDTETDELSSKDLEALSTSENGEGTNIEDCSINNTSHAQKNSHECETEEKKSEDAEKQVMKGGGMKSGDEKPSAKKSKLLDFSVLRECSFILYSLFGLLAMLGFFAPPLYIIELSVSRGVERDLATYTLSIMAVADIFGRLSIGWILTRERFRKVKLLVLLVCVIAMTGDLVGFTLAAEFYGLAVCCALYGFFMGTISCSHIPMLAEDDVVGIERMPSAAGVYVFIQSFAGLVGPPLGGVLVDVTQNYGSAFYSCAVGMGLSALFLSLVKRAKEGLLCRRRNSKRPEDADEREADSEQQRVVIEPYKRPDSPQDCSEVDDQTEATRDVPDFNTFSLG